MIVYPNQKIATVQKAPADKNHVYGVFSKDALFRACRELTGNEMKTFLYIAANQQGYQMALSSTDIAEQVGSTQDGIRTAIRGLIKKGYLVKERGNFYLFCELPECGNGMVQEKSSGEKGDKTEEKTMITNGKSSGCQGESKGEIIKEKYRKSTVKYNGEGPLSISNVDSDEWDEIFDRIKVKRFDHTMKHLEKAAGTPLEVRVVRKIVNDKWSAFENGMFEKEGYRLNTLANLLAQNYDKYKHLLMVQDAEYKRAIEDLRNQPKFDYEALSRRTNRKTEEIDIAKLLDEIFEDLDDAV